MLEEVYTYRTKHFTFLSSSRPSSTQYLATMLARQHVHLLDAPISGGVQRAREGTLAILVGGEHEVLEQQVPLLQTFGTQIFYMGGHGSGHLAKALNNLLSATSLASAIEAVLVGSRYGLDPSKFIAAVNASTGRSNSTEVKFPQFILPETFTDGFALSLMNKDIHIALEAAAEMDIPTRIGSCVGTVWQEAEEQGFGSTGHATLYTFLKNRLDQHESEKKVRHDERGVSSMLNEQNASPEQQDNKESEKNREIRVEQQDYIDEMVRKRGYVLAYHKVLTRQDFPVMQAADNLVHAAYLKERLLDRKTKELIFITSLTVMRSEKAHIQSHIRVALQLGLSAEEILEAIEITLPEAGVVAFQWGFDAWREVVNAQGIEPSKETNP